MISSSVSGAHSAFFSSHVIRWILFLMCTKKTASRHVSEDEEQQVKAQKQLFQILVKLYLCKLIDSGLYQSMRQHYNNSSQTEYSKRLKVNNLINRYSQVVHIKKTMRCVLALSMGWLVLKGYWNAHMKRLIEFFSQKTMQRRSRIMEVLLLHLVTQIYLHLHYIISAN